MKKYNLGCEVSLIAYNGRSMTSAGKESVITGLVVKVTKNYIHIRNWEDGLVWKSPRWI